MRQIFSHTNEKPIALFDMSALDPDHAGHISKIAIRDDHSLEIVISGNHLVKQVVLNTLANGIDWKDGEEPLKKLLDERVDFVISPEYARDAARLLAFNPEVTKAIHAVIEPSPQRSRMAPRNRITYILENGESAFDNCGDKITGIGISNRKRTRC